LEGDATKLVASISILPIDKTQRWVYNGIKEANGILGKKERAMTIYITNRKGNKLELNGDLLTGDTFSMKDYIKSYMDGKWVADQKAWRVNVAKVNKLIASYSLVIDTEPAVRDSGLSDAIIPQNMSYAEFSRRMNDPNSDL
jgi:hypothetical protein